MKLTVIKVAFIAVALGAAVYALGGTASASHVTVEIAMPSQIPLGRSVDVQATLLSADTGSPVPGTVVTFYTEASFGDVSGQVKLGQAITDENGVALLNHQPRSSGIHEIRIEYLPPGQSEPETASTAFSVAGSPQLHRSTSGIQIPGLNVWFLIALVATVWGILFAVAMRVLAIARAGDDGDVAPDVAGRPGFADSQPTPSESGVSGAR
jgi:hypothetical protein